jgi:hypothetical protein
MATMIHNIAAPETKRIVVKLAASIVVYLSAARQSNELPANATIANTVRMITRI